MKPSDDETAGPSMEGVEGASLAHRGRRSGSGPGRGRVDGDAVAGGGDPGEGGGHSELSEHAGVGSGQKLGEAPAHRPEAHEGDAQGFAQDGRATKGRGIARGPMAAFMSRSFRRRLLRVSWASTSSTAAWTCRSTGRIEQSPLLRHERSRPEWRSQNWASNSRPPRAPEGLAHRDLVGGAGQGVAAGLAARAGHEPGPPQDPHDLGHVRRRDALALAHLGDGEACVVAVARELEQAAQAVFLLGAELHRRLALTSAPAGGAPPRTSCSAPRPARRPPGRRSP